MAELQPPQPIIVSMSRTHDVEKLTGLGSRFAAFVAERHPFALPFALAAFESAGLSSIKGRDAVKLDAARPVLRRALAKALYDNVTAPEGIAETTPGTSALKRLEQARSEVVEACDGFLRRAAIEASLTKEERREILKGICLTRSVDNRLKQFFMGGEVRWGDMAFQGKGFRSLGQEAIYAGAIRLRRGPNYKKDDATWNGDVLAPVIRDLGMTLAMRHDEEAIAMILRAQMGKAGPPMSGKDLHTGDFAWGVLPAAAPLAVGSLSMAGMAMAFSIQKSERIALSFIGEGGSSLGEWHEAINACAAAKLPAIFCVQNNQTALSTPVRDNSATRVFADKAAGYGIPGLTIDGTDPDEIAAAFTWAAERARAGDGPTLIEVVAMRMCGHAHHDDMLYLGKDQPPSWEYHQLHETGYANKALYEYWAKRDPIPMYARRLEDDGVIKAGHLDEVKKWADELVDRAAQLVISEPWPKPELAGIGVFKDEAPRVRVEVLEPSHRLAPAIADLPPLETGLPFDKKGNTFLEAVMLGIGDALKNDPRVFVYGEDVGGQYGNAFLLLRPLLKDYGDRIRNSPLAEGAVLGVCVGAALAGLRPIGEMQFNDFVATGFNQLVNNAAKIRYRWGGEVPMVVRMPWGGLRHAGPYHSQNTEPWFYRTPGLKIVVPSTPRRRARVDGRRGRRSRSGVVLRAHRALPGSAHQAGVACRCAWTNTDRQGRPAAIGWRPGDDFVWRLRASLPARRRQAGRRRHRGLGPRPAQPRAARQGRHPRRDAALQPRADRPRGFPNRRHRRKPRRDHPGRGVRGARRADPHPRGARYAGALLAPTRRVLPRQRGRYCESREAAEGVLKFKV